MRALVICLVAICSELFDCGAESFAAGNARAANAPLEQIISLPNDEMQIRNFGGSLWWKSKLISNDAARWMRLKFTNISNRKKVEAYLVIRDGNERELLRYDLRLLDSTQPLITNRLLTKKVFTTLEAPRRPNGVNLRLRSYYYAVEDVPKPLSVPNKEQAYDFISALPKASREVILARAVVKIINIDSSESCSGFLVGDEVVTNEHCAQLSKFYLQDGRSCADIQFQFDYISDAIPLLTAMCRDVVVATGSLDVAKMRMRSVDAGKIKELPRLQFGEYGNLPTSVEVIHHPAGLPTALSKACQIVKVDGDGNLLHTCSTVPGSSGAPVIDSSGAVIAVHVDGYEAGLSKQEFDRRSALGEKFYNKAVNAKNIKWPAR